MKWAVVVYFMTASGWQSADALGNDKIGWSSVIFESYQQCFSRARMFNEDSEYRDRIKAVCEKVKN